MLFNSSQRINAGDVYWMRYTGATMPSTANRSITMRASQISQDAGRSQMRGDPSLFSTNDGFKGANRSVIHQTKET